MDFADAIAQVFAGPGASTLTWEVATRCTCWSDDSHQPQWGHALCGGYGVLFAAPVDVPGLFRSQSRWIDAQIMGELQLGEASLTLPLTAKPNYVDARVRDRFTVPVATGDAVSGRVFFPSTEPVPFLIGGEHLAWRVQLQSQEQANRTTPQP